MQQSFNTIIKKLKSERKMTEKRGNPFLKEDDEIKIRYKIQISLFILHFLFLFLFYINNKTMYI